MKDGQSQLQIDSYDEDIANEQHFKAPEIEHSINSTNTLEHRYPARDRHPPDCDFKTCMSSRRVYVWGEI